MVCNLFFPSFLFIGLTCSCKTGCKTKRCSCYKGSKGCSDLCKCPSELCLNKGQPSQAEERVVLGDKTNNISANSTACNTMSLLNDTYQVVEEVETSGMCSLKEDFLH